MHENTLLAFIAEQVKQLPPGVLVGPGDDCAVLEASAAVMLLTTDQLIELRHFVLAGTGPIGPTGGTASSGKARSARAGQLTLEQIARKAVARSVSDIAAMGGLPRWSLGTGALPRGMSDDHARTLTAAMHHWARHFGCPMVGGDLATIDGPMVLTVAVGGVPHARRGPVLRNGARPGDVLYVTGALGGSLASGRHASFEPRIAEAHALCTLLGLALHAMMDLSDGLGLDAHRMAKASGVTIELDSAALPIHADVPPSTSPSQDRWRAALGDGEDYELLIAIDPTHPVPALCPATNTPLTRVGRVRAAGDSNASGNRKAARAGTCTVLTPDGTLDASTMGWEHH